MARFIKDHALSKGQVPGSLILIGNQKMEKPDIWLIEYDDDKFLEKKLSSIEEYTKPQRKNHISWLNIDGLHDMEMIKSIGEIFGLHPLLLEDIVNTDHTPKYYKDENYEVIILKMLSYDKKVNKIVAEQVTLILWENFLLTLQEQPGDVFDSVRDRIRSHKGRIRANGHDYLAFSLLDSIADNYILLIETIGIQIEYLEEKIFHTQDDGTAEEIYYHKTELNYLRKTIRPVKEVMFQLLKSEDTFFQKKNHSYLLNLNDMINQAADAIELYSNILSDQLNIYNSNINRKTNQVVKILTIFTSVFIPLTFLAGIYGMNFKYMPELNYKYSYPIFWGIIIFSAIVLLTFFKKKKWL